VSVLDRLGLGLEWIVLPPELGGVHEAGGDKDSDGRAEHGQEDVHADFEWRQVVWNDPVCARVIPVSARCRVPIPDRVEFAVRNDRLPEVALVILQRDVRQVVLVNVLVDKVVLHVNLLVLDLDDDVSVGDSEGDVG